MARLKKSINLDWKFHRGDCPDAWFRGYDDSTWRNVTLPHDWSVEEAFSPEHSSGGGYLPGGVGWYRMRFTLPEELKGMKAWIVFDGVYNGSMVWANSYYLGKRPYGYSTFAYDITHAAGFGKEETQISVRVNHEHSADSRWYTGSGITRKVGVIVKEPLYIDLNGVFFSTVKAGAGSARVRVRTAVVNETGKDAAVLVRNTLLDTSGRAAASMEKGCKIPAGQSAAVEQGGTVRAPRLWSPDSPDMYTLRTEIVSGGREWDAEDIPVGIRAFRFDSDRGFFLNGRNMKLKGVCVHHDAGCLGAAVVKKVWERRLKALKGMGCNAIRMSHNPHMPELYDLCDSMGFLVIDEAFDEWEGPKNKWAVGHNAYPPQHYGYYEDFPEWHEKDLAAMVLRDRNHPSVILWSIGNEIDYPNDPYCHPLFREMSGNNDANKPASERAYNPDKPNAERLVAISKRLAALVKQWDDTRPVTANLSFPELSNLTGLCDTLDVCGYSYKESRYEEDHAEYPKRILLGSENNKDFANWLAVREHDYISGQFLWTGIDFLGEAHGWPIHGSMSGHLTLAGFVKPQYYFRKSLWTKEPMVQLATLRKFPERAHPWQRHAYEAFSWNYDPGENVTVICYTNCPDVEIRINGEPLGAYRAADLKDDGCISFTAPFREGVLEAAGIAEDGTRVTSALKSARAPAGMLAAPDCPELRADGEDIAQLEIAVVDGEGTFAPDANDLISVSVEGAGALIGIENGDLADNTPYASASRRAYRGRLLAFVRAAREPGAIRVTCRAKGLRDAVVDLTVQ